ncbi:hypothetical protein WBG78_24515 [Chryseolinea sp. T2]|uniref:hypothetical protein n=1 Tax=Chryseolinea sp. T2 TaxID=3129255 RepID=UPI00307750F8
MKKIAAILFASLVLLNSLGFYGILVGIQYHSGRALESRLDRDQYDPAETVTLKFPMALPYHGDQKYQRVDGKVEHKGEYYRLVKQKLEKDTLYIVCIKDRDSKLIAEALSDYVKTYTDKPGDAKQTLKAFNFIKDYLPTTTDLICHTSGWNHDIQFMSSAVIYNSVPATHKSPPPRD